MTKPNSNVLHALENFKTWIGWYPADCQGATEFAGDMLETTEEVDCFERELLEAQVYDAFLRRGWVIPQTEEDVRIVEQETT